MWHLQSEIHCPRGLLSIDSSHELKDHVAVVGRCFSSYPPPRPPTNHVRGFLISTKETLTERQAYGCYFLLNQFSCCQPITTRRSSLIDRQAFGRRLVACSTEITQDT